ncbi:hypothetical protein H0H93_013273, partial [Arthromyces matolae]
MVWKNQPDVSGVYEIKVYNQDTRYWKFIADGEYWIKLESFRNGDDSFKWRLDKVSGGWTITPLKNPSIGFRSSPQKRPNGDGIYWSHGFPQGRRGASAVWKINVSPKWSTISIDWDVLDSRMDTGDGRHAKGVVHFYDPDNFDTTNQHWIFQRAGNDNNNDNNNGDDGDVVIDDDNKGDDGDVVIDDDNGDGGDVVIDDDKNGDKNSGDKGDKNGGGKRGSGKTFEDLWFGLTPEEAAKENAKG